MLFRNLATIGQQRWMIALLALTCWGYTSATAAETDSITAQQWVQRVQNLMRSQRSISRYTMQITTPEWQRSVEMESWEDRPNHRFFIRILAPRKERNTTWLKDGGNLWMYLPKLERDIRIPPSMMLSSWMGSDFTNDDLVKMESMVEDYNHRIISSNSQQVVIASTPKRDAAIVWGKIIHTINRDGIPIADDFYDQHGIHIRHLQFDRVITFGDRRLPSRWIMHKTNQTGKTTTLILRSIRFDPPIAQTIFTRANLRRKASP